MRLKFFPSPAGRGNGRSEPSFVSLRGARHWRRSPSRNSVSLWDNLPTRKIASPQKKGLAMTQKTVFDPPRKGEGTFKINV